MIEVKQLVKKYGEMTAVKGISFSAAQGVNGFLGPNGAGKTTTMRVLTGYTPPTSGTATVAGFDVFEQSYEVRRHVGYLPENVPLYRDLTALEYLAYLAEIRGLPKRREQSLAALERVGLAQRAHSRIRTLSKGMRQRVGLAAAILHKPSVLILDEPTIGLDPLQVLELRKLIVELGKECTVLFSTHILSEAEQVCDRLIIINQGEIVSEGTPSELRRQLERGGRILVRSQAASDALAAALRDVEGVALIQPYDDGVIVTPQPAAPDLRPAIAARLVSAALPLVELRPLAVNLEDIFIELVRTQNVTPTMIEEEVSA
ncbi:ABC transporter ATP-binding protein [Aggregatilineales bacterium SYSU G02658]